MDFILTDDAGPPPEGYVDIWTASIWHWGLMRRWYAWEAGKRAIRIRVRAGGPRRPAPDRVAPKGNDARPKKPRKPRGRQDAKK